MAAEDALVGGLGQSAGGLLGYGLGVGDNRRTATDFYNSGEYNPDAANYGGYGNGLRDTVANNAYDAAQADGRTANTANYTDAYASKALAGQDRQQSQGDRQSQADVLNVIKARALGNQPTIAQQQADRQTGQLVSSQGAQAASARTQAGLAMSGQTAAGNIANGTSNISNNAQINAAQEKRQDATDAATGFSNLRQGDQGQQGLEQSQQGIDTQQQQFNAQQEQANRDSNDKRAMQYNQMNADAKAQALNAHVQNEAVLSQSHTGSEQANQQTAQNNASNKKGWFESIFSDERAKDLLSPLTKIYNPSSAPVDATGNSQDLHDGEFVDPGASNPMAALKANSDYATRYSKNPSSTAFYSDEITKKPATQIAMLGLGPLAAEASAVHDYVKKPEGSPREVAKDHVSLDQPRRGRDFDDGSPERRAELAAVERANRQSYIDENKRLDAMAAAAKHPKAKQDLAAEADKMMQGFDVSRIKGPAVSADKEDGKFYSDENTKLPPGETAGFAAWKKKYAPAGDKGNDYDYAGAYETGVTPDKNHHFPDQFKKSSHKTFSSESQYAKPGESFGGTTAGTLSKAGAWQGDKFIPPSKPGSDKGVALTRGPGGLGVGDPNAPTSKYVPGVGWVRPQAEEDQSPDTIGRLALDREISKRVAEDNANRDIDQALSDQKTNDARLARDPAVGLGRAPKGYARGREVSDEERTSWLTPKQFGMNGAQNRTNADDVGVMADKGPDKYGYAFQGGSAPGTEDFERSAPKADQSKSRFASEPDDLNGGFLSDTAAKEKAVFAQGHQAGRDSAVDDATDAAADVGVGALFGAPAGIAAAADRYLPSKPKSMLGKAAKTGVDVTSTAYGAALGVPLGGGMARQEHLRQVEEADAVPRREMKSFTRDPRPEGKAPPVAQSPEADAARSMQGEPYKYKAGLGTGGTHYGPMAQNMVKSPVAGTAIEKDAGTGLMKVNQEKALKVNMAVSADHQKQLDEMARRQAELESALALQKGDRVPPRYQGADQ